jgi:hypothetical protein
MDSSHMYSAGCECPRSRDNDDCVACIESIFEVGKFAFKVIARNTFLTIADDKADHAVSNLRSSSH